MEASEAKVLGLGEEYPQPDEEENIKKMGDVTLEIMKFNGQRAGTKDDNLPRDVHSKTYGCVKGVFEIDPDLDGGLRTGVFQPGARYPVIIRLSPGLPGFNPDGALTGHGFAMKLLQVDAVMDKFNVPADERAWLSFSIILQKDPKIQPIEDSTIVWPSSDKDIADRKPTANRAEIGRLTIPPQDFSSVAATKRCDRLSYNPWNSLAAHRPLGNTNRARKVVYLTGASNRVSDRSLQKPDDEQLAILKKYSAYGLVPK